VVNRKLVVIAIVALVAALAACSAIIGTRDLELATSDAGTPVNDSSMPGADVNVGPMGDSGGMDVVTPPPADGGGPEAAPACNGADLTSDPKNCGTCGHDCLGGACAPMMGDAGPIGPSVCQPAAIVPSLAVGVWGLALTANSVYWTTAYANQVLTAQKDGGAVTVVAHDPDGGEVSSPEDIQVDEAFVYWMDSLSNTNSSVPTDVGRIARCPLSGCGDAASTVLATNIGYPVGMKVDDAGIYWADYNSNGIQRANKFDGGSVHIFAVNNSANSIQDLSIDSQFVYWSTNGDLDRVSMDAGGPDGGPYSTLYTAPTGGGAPFATTGIAVDDTNFYFVVNIYDGLVESIPKSGVGTGQPTKIASAINPYRITVDATNIYWVNQVPDTQTDPNNPAPIYLNGTIMTCPKTGCPASGPILLAQNQSWPMFIAVDDKAVYWTNQGNNVNDGAVMKVAK
jgi:hypothetical protein